MIEAPGYSSAALVPVPTRSEYFASAAHYEVVARRVVGALRGSSRSSVLVTGDPPANPQVLSEALGNVAGPGSAVVIIPCGPELTREDVERSVCTFANAQRAGSAGAEPAFSVLASRLFVFDNFDRLSDKQIEELYESTLSHDRMRGMAVLLAPLDFLVRLERPALHFLKDRIAAKFRFQEVGDDEAIGFLHDQLFAQRDRRAETRAFRRGILVGLAVGTSVFAIMAATIGVFIVHPTDEPVNEVAASTGQGSLAREESSVLRPGDAMATIAAPTRAAEEETASITATAPPPLSTPSPPMEGEDPAPLAVPSAAPPPAGPSLSTGEIAALLARGDAFLSAGDITSARLFYERAAEGESGPAALQLGATFDPVLSGRAVLRGAAAADPVQALFWYRRARELGAGEAEDRIKALENRSSGEPDRFR